MACEDPGTGPYFADCSLGRRRIVVVHWDHWDFIHSSGTGKVKVWRIHRIFFKVVYVEANYPKAFAAKKTKLVHVRTLIRWRRASYKVRLKVSPALI